MYRLPAAGRIVVKSFPKPVIRLLSPPPCRLTEISQEISASLGPTFYKVVEGHPRINAASQAPFEKFGDVHPPASSFTLSYPGLTLLNSR
jgi:hypothetical protein